MSNPLTRVGAPPPLHIDITYPSPATTRIAPAGEIDLATAPDLLDTLLNLLHTRHPAVLDVDLTDVSFLACAGVSVLACVRNAAARAGCQLRISNPQPMVRMVLELTWMPSDATAAPLAEASRPRHPARREAAATTMTPTPEAVAA
jgi:anti-anti-sigma factor